MGELAFVIRVKDDGSAVVERFGANVKKTGKAVGQTAGRMTRAFGAVRGGLSKTLGSVFNLRNAIIGLGAVAVIRTVVKSFADFETQMNRVRVLTGATGTDFSSLKDLALELGRTTAFSAKQSADAMGFLAMAGFEVDEVIGALPRTLELAAAAQLELGDAADIVTNILTGLQIPLEDLGKANDVLVKAFTSTNTNLQQLGQAFKFVGPIATSAGLQFEEVTAVLGLLGNAGIQASMAGTTLRGSIAKLLNPSAEAVKVLKRLGVTAVNSSGKLVPFSSVIEQLGEGGATTADIFKIFGQRAGPGVAVLLSQGSKAIRKLTKELEDSGGTAKEAAEVQLEGLNGALIRMKSAVEGAAISIGEQLSPFISDGAEAVKEFAGSITTAVAALVEAAGGTEGFGKTLRKFFPTATTLVRVFFTAARTVEILKIAFKAVQLVIFDLARALNTLFLRFREARQITIRMKELADEIRSAADNIRDLALEEERVVKSLAVLQQKAADAMANQSKELRTQKIGTEVLAKIRTKLFELETSEMGKALDREERFFKQSSLLFDAAILEKVLGIKEEKTLESQLFKFRLGEEIAIAAKEFKIAEDRKAFLKDEKLAAEEIIKLRGVSFEKALQILAIAKKLPETGPFDAEAVAKSSLKVLDQSRALFTKNALSIGDTSRFAIQIIGDLSVKASASVSETLDRVDEASRFRIVSELARFKGTEDQKLAFVKQRVQEQITFERQATLQATASLFGALASLAETGGAKQFKIVQKFQIAEAIISGILAVQKTLASLPFPANLVAAAAIAVQTIANVRRIRQAKPGGGAGGGFNAPGGGGGGGPGAPGAIEGPAEAAATGGLMEVNISVAGFVGDEAQLASEIGRVLREAEGDGVEVSVST